MKCTIKYKLPIFGSHLYLLKHSLQEQRCQAIGFGNIMIGKSDANNALKSSNPSCHKKLNPKLDCRINLYVIIVLMYVHKCNWVTVPSGSNQFIKLTGLFFFKAEIF